jgi:hypothetical protein
MPSRPTILIQPTEGQASCGGCARPDASAACPAHAVQPCEATELVGPGEELQRVLAALAQRPGFAADAPQLVGVRALRLEAGEAELQLAWPAHCGGAAFADTAFDTLRQLLPDTDIYVTHRR